MENISELDKAQEAIHAERYADAVAILEPLCSIGNSTAQSMLGVLYQLGFGGLSHGYKGSGVAYFGGRKRQRVRRT